MNTSSEAAIMVTVEGKPYATHVVDGVQRFIPHPDVVASQATDTDLPHRMLAGVLAGDIPPSGYLEYLIMAGTPVENITAHMAYPLLRLGGASIEVDIINPARP